MNEETKNYLSNSMFFQNIQLKFKIKNQIEFYFGETNYYKDIFLLNQRDHDGYVPIHVISNFRRM
jgi:hypothetical protein